MKHRIYLDIVILLLACGFFSCSKEDDVNEDILEEEITNIVGLYTSETTYTGTLVAQIKIHPAHRTGPNPIPQNLYSNLPLSIWIPVGAPQPFPVVVYSHGGGSRSTPGVSGEEWGQFLSNSGYAVIAMHHMQRSQQDLIQNICGELNIPEIDCVPEIYIHYYESIDRPQDAVAVMDSLEVIGNKIGYSFDENQIAMMGFSGGTNTTLYLAGGERNATYSFSPDSIYFSLSNPRPKAFLAMSSGAGTHAGWTANSLQSIHRPYLCATGSADLSSDKRAEFYDQLSGTDQFRLYINSESALHGVFNHGLLDNPDHKEIQKLFHTWLESTNVAFLDAYLKGKINAKEWLKSNQLPEIINEKLEEHHTFPTWSYR